MEDQEYIYILLTIYLCNIYITYIYYSNKGKYIHSNDGALTRWRHYVCTTPIVHVIRDMPNSPWKGSRNVKPTVTSPVVKRWKLHPTIYTPRRHPQAPGELMAPAATQRLRCHISIGSSGHAETEMPYFHWLQQPCRD